MALTGTDCNTMCWVGLTGFAELVEAWDIATSWGVIDACVVINGII
jgi:hypothetical protein